MAVQVQELRLPGPGGRSLPLLEVDSGWPGPLAVVTANLHGDEATGVGAVHALARELGPLLLRGAVRLFPSLNPWGLAQGIRGLPGEETDPNRCFPGNPNGGPAARHAHALWALLLSRRPDLVIDLHTDAADAEPYALVDRVLNGAPGLEERCHRLALASGLFTVLEYPPDDYRRFGLDQSLAGALVNHVGISAVTLEIGPRRWIAPHAVDLAVRATLGVLTAAGLVSRPAPPSPPGRWHRQAGPRATRAGVLTPRVRSGQDVSAGQPLGEVRALSGVTLETLHADSPGRVLSLSERAWITPGSIVLTLAVQE